MTQPVVIIETSSAKRRRMARRLGFRSMRAFEEWEEEIVLDHFANFICDYLAPGYTIVPDKRGFAEFVNLDREVEQRVQALEERRFEVVLNPDKNEWRAKDHYKHFIIGVVADDQWLGKHGIDCADIWKRNWTAKETTSKMFRYLLFLVREWYDGAGDDSHRRKMRQAQLSRH
ncbi:hypothetical protein C8A03DRAFT_18178 [Achaetomium macrosporum]|uniref:Uncharacterized protein n=1 Tax=Achaetomium macrosporum TaxID=79813 RepID=A0AAN7H919_9PEZI|nr:hypothetical protein C8A03DRAFT_18178 [Achaetomium macrosporum]